MARRLIPSLNRVLVEKLVQPKKSAGGILLPETSKQVSPTLFFPPSISRGATAASPCCFELAASVMGSGEGRGVFRSCSMRARVGVKLGAWCSCLECLISIASFRVLMAREQFVEITCSNDA